MKHNIIMLCYRIKKSRESFMNQIKLYRVRPRKVLDRHSNVRKKRGMS